MKIAIDSGPLKGGDSVRGIGVYVRELASALQNSKKIASLRGQNFQIEVSDVSKLDLSKYDVIHFTQFNPFKISILFNKPSNTKFILTIYDLIPLIYPKHYPPGLKGWMKWQINKYLIRKNVDAIITISETSKKDICRFLGVDPNRVFVTYLAPRKIFKKINNPVYPGLPGKFALYVGDINYNKNISGVIDEACKMKLPLVIVGKQAKEWVDDKLDLSHPELSHLAGVKTRNVIALGFIPDYDLVKIYNLATVYLQMSFYEGFGLPLLEAKACGTPIKFNKTQALVEIIDHNDYSWEKTAEETLKVYKNV